MTEARARRPRPQTVDNLFWPEDDALLEAELRYRLRRLEWFVLCKRRQWDAPHLADAAVAQALIDEGHTPPAGLPADSYPPGYPPPPPEPDHVARMSPACRASITQPFDRTYDGMRFGAPRPRDVEAAPEDPAPG